MIELEFQDRCLKPLGHPSVFGVQRLSRGMGWGKVSIAVHRRARGADLRGRRRALSLGSPAPCEISRRRPRRTRKPASSSTAARNRLRSMRGSCRTPSHEYACCTCHSRSWSELIKTFGISWFERVVIAQGQALERKPSNAWAMKIPALNRPRNAVTVSIIAKSFAALARTQRHETAHSQKDSGAGPKIRPE